MRLIKKRLTHLYDWLYTNWALLVVIAAGVAAPYEHLFGQTIRTYTGSYPCEDRCPSCVNIGYGGNATANYQFYDKGVERVYHGPFKLYSSQGVNKTTVIGQYVHGLKDGTWRLVINELISAKLFGPANRKLIIEVIGKFSRGVRTGQWIYTSTIDGKVKTQSTCYFLQGQYVGRFYYSNGEKKLTCKFDSTGLLHDTMNYRYQDGNGIYISEERRFEHGILKYTLVKNTATGEVIKFNDNEKTVNELRDFAMKSDRSDLINGFSPSDFKMARSRDRSFVKFMPAVLQLKDNLENVEKVYEDCLEGGDSYSSGDGWYEQFGDHFIDLSKNSYFEDLNFWVDAPKYYDDDHKGFDKFFAPCYGAVPYQPEYLRTVVLNVNFLKSLRDKAVAARRQAEEIIRGRRIHESISKDSAWLEFAVDSIRRKASNSIEWIDVPSGAFKSSFNGKQLSVNVFSMSKYEVTVGQWEQYRLYLRLKDILIDVKSAGVYTEEFAERVHLSCERLKYMTKIAPSMAAFVIQSGRDWNECMRFVEWLGGRLPTLPEWERAATYNISGKRLKYPGSNNFDEVGHYLYEDSYGIKKGNTVGTLKPNELGFYDLAGNVGELCYLDSSDVSSFNHSADPNLNRIVKLGRATRNDQFGKQLDPHAERHFPYNRNHDLGYSVVSFEEMHEPLNSYTGFVAAGFRLVKIK